MRIFLTLLLLFSFVKAEFVFDDMAPPVKEEIIDYDSTANDEPDDTVSQEELKKDSEQILDDVIQTKEKLETNKKYKKANEQNIFLTLVKSPKKVILSQRAVIVIKATISRDDVDFIKADFGKNSAYKVLNPHQMWTKLDENSYIVTYYIKYLTISPPDINAKVIVRFENREKNSSFIKIPKPKMIVLKSDEFFSGVIAKKLKILSHSEKRYDDRYNIVLMEINATLSNLGDFHLPYAKKSGIDEYIDKGETQKAYAYAIVGNRAKNFKFKYFDLKTNHYKMNSFDIVLKDQTLSTQTELNPQKNKYTIYKTIFLLLVIFLLLILSLRKRSIGLSIILVILLIYTVYINIPFKTIILKKGVGLKILPTQNSTIFYIVSKDMKAVVAYENKKYYKVILPDGKHIGWVRKNVK